MATLRNVNVWASNKDFGRVDAEPEQFTDVEYPKGSFSTQAGWDVPLLFGQLVELADQLEKGVKLPKRFVPPGVGVEPTLQRGEINRLALMMHGDEDGVAKVNGKSAADDLRPATVAKFQPTLTRIGLFTKPDISTIIIMGCLAGKGDPGTRLLKLLSEIFPGRAVVAFSTIGFRHPARMIRRGETPHELPGMKDTDIAAPLFANKKKIDELDAKWATLEWASEFSPHAKVVRNGVVIKCPEGEVCK